MTLPPVIQALLARIRGWLDTLPPLPGGLKLWISLLSFGFLLAALVGHGRQLLQLSLDGQGWLWLLLAVGVSLLSLVANGVGLGVVLRWLGQRPRWPELVRAYLHTNLRKYLPGGIWHLTSRVQLLRSADVTARSNSRRERNADNKASKNSTQPANAVPAPTNFAASSTSGFSKSRDSVRTKLFDSHHNRCRSAISATSSHRHRTRTCPTHMTLCTTRTKVCAKPMSRTRANITF